MVLTEVKVNSSVFWKHDVSEEHIAFIIRLEGIAKRMKNLQHTSPDFLLCLLFDPEYLGSIFSEIYCDSSTDCSPLMSVLCPHTITHLTLTKSGRSHVHMPSEGPRNARSFFAHTSPLVRYSEGHLITVHVSTHLPVEAH